MKVPRARSGPFCWRFSWFIFAEQKASKGWIGGSVLLLPTVNERSWTRGEQGLCGSCRVFFWPRWLSNNSSADWDHKCKCDHVALWRFTEQAGFSLFGWVFLSSIQVKCRQSCSVGGTWLWGWPLDLTECWVIKAGFKFSTQLSWAKSSMFLKSRCLLQQPDNQSLTLWGRDHCARSDSIAEAGREERVFSWLVRGVVTEHVPLLPFLLPPLHSFWCLNIFDLSFIPLSLCPGVSSFPWLPMRPSFLFRPQVPFSAAAFFSAVDLHHFPSWHVSSSLWSWAAGSLLLLGFRLSLSLSSCPWASANVQLGCGEKIIQCWGKFFSILCKCQFARIPGNSDFCVMFLVIDVYLVNNLTYFTHLVALKNAVLCLITLINVLHWVNHTFIQVCLTA